LKAQVPANRKAAVAEEAEGERPKEVVEAVEVEEEVGLMEEEVEAAEEMQAEVGLPMEEEEAAAELEVGVKAWKTLPRPVRQIGMSTSKICFGISCTWNVRIVKRLSTFKLFTLHDGPRSITQSSVFCSFNFMGWGQRVTKCDGGRGVSKSVTSLFFAVALVSLLSVIRKFPLFAQVKQSHRDCFTPVWKGGIFTAATSV
jgi:hypothetical protein